jgi:predicted nicotinamide N-methyase
VTLVRQRVSLPGGALELLQPADAAELPDDGAAEWAPLVPYSEVLWRSGVALGRAVAGTTMAGLRVVEIGCGMGVPSLAAARAGADVLATDTSPEALGLLARNARANGLTLMTAHADWTDPGDLVARGPFDLVLGADVLYEREAVDALLALLPRLAPEAWLADPGRAPAAEFLARAPDAWSVTTAEADDVRIHRMHAA